MIDMSCVSIHRLFRISNTCGYHFADHSFNSHVVLLNEHRYTLPTRYTQQPEQQKCHVRFAECWNRPILYTHLNVAISLLASAGLLLESVY